MLNQLIYTRCMPHRELKNKGQVLRSDGFGVFSMSQGMVTDQPVPNYDFLQSRLALPNGAKESSPAGLFNSYEYTALAPDVYALSYEVARPLCKVPRKNGRGHRSGTYIKQCLVGRPEGYPFMWFGASVWDAHVKTENDYYLDDNPNAEPAWLSPVSEKPAGSYITLDKVRQFVRDGRTEAVKSGIWFLIQELSKPENERKVLLIKDVPENVELWIAALEYAFSAEMAKGITFTTNRSKLSTQADNALFYYTDESGRFYPMLNRSIQQTRHPYNMIVGYHPKDNFAASVRQLPNSNFVIIDGLTKSSGITADDSIQSAYYTEAVQYGEDIKDFTGDVLPSLPIDAVTDQIPALYDAYKYLLDSEHKAEKWNYREALAHLRVLLQFGIPQSEALNKYILDEGLRAYQRFATEDERNNYQLLKILWDISCAINRSGEVTGCLADQISADLMDLNRSGNSLISTWNAVKAGGVQDIIKPVLLHLFNDSELGSYVSQLRKASPRAVSTVLDMYFQTLALERNGVNSILDSKEKFNFVCAVLESLVDDKNALMAALNGIRTNDDLVNSVALAVSEYLEKNRPDKTQMWWDSIIELSGGSVMNLCATLSKSPKTGIDMIERLLANAVRKAGRFERDHYRAFESALKTKGRNMKTGVQFFSACIDVEAYGRLDNVIRCIRGSGLSPMAEKELFRIADSYMPYDASGGMAPQTFREMKEWGLALNEVSESVAFYDLRKDLERERRADKLLPKMDEFISYKINLPNSFITSQYFDKIAHTAAALNDPQIHMAFLHLFRMPDKKTKQDYVKAYVDRVLSSAKGKQLAYAMLRLSEVFYYDFEIPGVEEAELKETAGMVKSYFKKVLPDYYKANLEEQVAKFNEFEEGHKNELLKMLREAEGNAPKGGVFGGIFGNLFGRK